MIKKCYMLIDVLLIISVIGFVSVSEDNTFRTVAENIPISKDKPIVLNLPKLNVELIGWDSESISIKRTDLLTTTNAQTLFIKDDDNSLTISGYDVSNQINSCLDTWLPIAQTKHFKTSNPLFSIRSHLIVYLPKNSEVIIDCDVLNYSSNLIVKITD